MKLFLDKKKIKTLSNNIQDLPVEATPHVAGAVAPGPSNTCTVATRSACQTIACGGGGGSIPCYSNPCPTISNCETTGCDSTFTDSCETLGCGGGGDL